MGTYAPGQEKSITDFLLGHPLDWVDPNAGVTPLAAPQTVHDYSGGGYVAAEQILQAATGESYADWVTDNVLAPLNLSRSTYDLASSGISNLATACGLVCLGYLPLNGYVQEGSLVKAGTGFIGHPKDYAKLLGYFYRNGQNNKGVQKLDPSVIEKVLTPGWHTNSSNQVCSIDDDCSSNEICWALSGKCKNPLENTVSGGDYYGLGVTLSEERLADGLPRIISHGGVNDGYAGEFKLDRQTGRGVVIMVNGDKDKDRESTRNGVTRSTNTTALGNELLRCWDQSYL